MPSSGQLQASPPLQYGSLARQASSVSALPQRVTLTAMDLMMSLLELMRTRTGHCPVVEQLYLAALPLDSPRRRPGAQLWTIAQHRSVSASPRPEILTEMESRT